MTLALDYWQCIITANCLKLASSIEISGVVNFQIKWNEFEEDVDNSILVNGKPIDLASSEARNVGHEHNTAAAEAGPWPRNDKGRNPEKMARKRRWAPAPPDGSYVRHGPGCIKKQRQMATTLERANPRVAGSDHNDDDDDKAAPKGVPGIAEAPPEIAAEKPGPLEILLTKGKEENEEEKRKEPKPVAVEVGEDGLVQEKERGVHIAVMVEEGEEARMACHYCEGPNGKDAPETEEDGDRSRRSMIWYRISRKRQGREFYRVREVNLDMHDDPELNHVYVTETHTLVIKEARLRHRATYFCRDAADQSHAVRKRISELDLSKFFRSDGKLRFLYHLDVVPPSEVKARLVKASPEENSNLPLPSPPSNVSEMNVEVISVWQEWSQCSVCGDDPGTRRRLGECTVRREARDTPDSKFSFIGMLLSLYRDGVPCRSSLFYGHEALAEHVSRPDELQEEECQVSCSNYSSRVAQVLKSYSGEELERKLADVKVKVKESEFLEPEGHSITLKCPGAPLDMPVAWINGSRILIGPLLHRVTNGRVQVDEKSHLHIKTLRQSDAGPYACVVAGRVRGRIMLHVKPLPAECKSCRYFLYLLYTYPIDFLLFCIFWWVRHKERKKVLNYELLGRTGGSFSTLTTEEGDEDVTSNALMVGGRDGAGGDAGFLSSYGDDDDFNTSRAPAGRGARNSWDLGHGDGGDGENRNWSAKPVDRMTDGDRALRKSTPISKRDSKMAALPKLGWGITDESGVVYAEGKSIKETTTCTDDEFLKMAISRR